MAIIILGDKQSKTLSKLYEYVQEYSSHSIKWLDGNDFVNNIIINDEIVLDKVAVSWKIDNSHLTPSNVTGIFNQLGFLNSECFNDFHPDDVEYAKSEFNAYLLFSLNQFNNVINPPWNGGISGFCQSLPYQWHYIQSLKLPIEAPDYHFGMASRIPSQLLDSKNLIISKDIYEYGCWSSNQESLMNFSGPVLCYERPAGIPAVITSFNDNIYISDFYGNCIDQKNIKSTIFRVASELMRHFNLKIATILVFIDDKLKITFGSIEPGFNIEYVPKNKISNLLSLITSYLSTNANTK